MRCDRKTMRLYAVTDRAWVGQGTLGDQVEQALRGGVTCVQLRENLWESLPFWWKRRRLGHFAGPMGSRFSSMTVWKSPYSAARTASTWGKRTGPPGRSDACWDLTGFWAYPPGLWSKRCRRSGTARIIWGSAQFFHLHQGGCHAGVL